MNELIDFLKQEDVKQFIRENLGKDVNQLILNPPSEFKEYIKDIAAQILARQKAKGKLDGWATNMDLIMPPPLSIEQASSTVTCEYKAPLVSGSHLIDLTGGMGIDFLALSKSFARGTYVEKEAALCDVFKHNAEILGTQPTVINDDALSFLAICETDSGETVIYLDPARRDQQKSRVFKIEDCSPNLIELIPTLRKKASRVLIKYSPLLDIQAILNAIPCIEEIHVVSVKNDCKELLILVNFEFEGDPEIRCVNLESNQPDYTFRIVEERSADISLGNMDQYLYEPNSSVLKAGAFKKIATDFEMVKLSENTHLYTSGRPLGDFPGRIFKVLSNADKKSIRVYAPEGKINVIARNHPLPATDIKKKWKLKDGGDNFLIAFRNSTGKAEMVIATRLDLSK